MTTRTDHRRELRLTEEDVRAEHLASVRVPAHWAYLLGVLSVSFLAMIGLMVILAATAPTTTGG